MQYLTTVNVVGDQLHDQALGNLVQSGGKILHNEGLASHGTSHACKDKWRTRANAKDLVVVRKAYQEIH